MHFQFYYIPAQRIFISLFLHEKSSVYLKKAYKIFTFPSTTKVNVLLLLDFYSFHVVHMCY